MASWLILSHVKHVMLEALETKVATMHISSRSIDLLGVDDNSQAKLGCNFQIRKQNSYVADLVDVIQS